MPPGLRRPRSGRGLPGQATDPTPGPPGRSWGILCVGNGIRAGIPGNPAGSAGKPPKLDGDTMRVTHGEVERELLALVQRQQSEVFGVIVWRRDRRTWSVAVGV